MAKISGQNSVLYTIYKAKFLKVNPETIDIRYLDPINKEDTVSRTYLQIQEHACHIEELVPNLDLDVVVNPSDNSIDKIKLFQVEVCSGMVENLIGENAAIAYGTLENQIKIKIPIREIHNFGHPISIGSFTKVFKDSLKILGISLALCSRQNPQSFSRLNSVPIKPINQNPMSPDPNTFTPSPSANHSILLNGQEPHQTPPKKQSDLPPAPNTFPQKENKEMSLGMNSLRSPAKSLSEIISAQVCGSERYILPISSFKQSIKNTELDEDQLDTALSEYYAWRRLNGDKNSFYRAIGVVYLEHLCRTTTNIKNFESFINLLESIPTIELNRYSRATFISGLRSLLDLKRLNMFCLTKLNELIGNINFDRDLVSEIRCLAATSLGMLQNSDLIQNFVGSDITPHMHSIYNLEQEAEEWVIICMANILHVCIKHVCINQKEPGYFEPLNGVEFPMLHIINSINQYDLLYTYSQLRVDCYDTITYTYTPYSLEPIELLHLRKTLYITKDKINSIKNLQKPVVNKNEIVLADYCSTIQDILMRQFELLQEISYQVKLQPSKFPRLNNLLRYQDAVIPLVSRDIHQDEKMIELLNKENHILSLYNSSNASIYIFNSCVLCSTGRSDLALSCDHSFCMSHIKDHVLAVTRGFVFFNQYEQSYSIYCPVCRNTLNDSDIDQIFTLEEKQMYCNYAEQRKREYMTASGIHHCLECQQDLDTLHFMNFHSCMCIMCHAKLLRQGYRQCQHCSTQYSDQMIRNFNSATFSCMCGKQYVFKNIKDTLACHLLCPDCLLQSVETAQCSHCSRPLDYSELERIKPKILVICQGCNKHRSSMRFQVDKECGCMVCGDCVVAWEAGDKLCKVCHTFLKKAIKMVQDMICGESFPEEDMVSIRACGCLCCEKCMRFYLELQIRGSESVNGNIKCMNHLCQSFIDPSTIQKYITPELSNLLNETVIFANYNITDCPNCKEKFEYINRGTTCPKCNHKFCAKCRKPQHVEDCLIIQNKELIEAFINDGKPVAQCPGCFEVYSKDDACEHVECVNPKCKVAFCFVCACFRSPTLEHSNAYHRPECKFYAPDSEQPKYLPDKCTECKKKGSVCDKPGSLPRRALFIPE